MHLDYHELFLQLPGFWIIKDKNLRYIDANDNFLQQITQIKIKGKTDFDMPWSHAQANKYRHDDMRVLQGASLHNYTETQLRGGNLNFRVKVNKMPMYKNDKIIGVICHFIDICKITVTSLSPQQHKVLQCIVEGCTAKEVARQLNLSVRTVESYTEHLKFKFNCRNKGELIKRGLLHLSSL